MKTAPSNPTGLNPGDTVKHSHHVTEHARDYWLSCGREPMKSGAKRELDRLTAARGTVTEVKHNGHAWAVSVQWDDGPVSSCLPHRVTIAEPAPIAS